ncbi:MAG: alpha/beta fold hydrolase [Planctomycetota bacterium]
MFTRTLRLCRAHWLACSILFLLTLGIGVNAVAFRHAWAMSHFVEGGVRTREPIALSFVEKASVLVTGVRLPKPINTRSPADEGLEFETLHFSSTDGVDLESWYIPTENPRGIILFFHGYGSCKMAHLTSASILRGKGYDCLLVDERGAGGSGGNFTTLGFLEAKDVAGAVQFARRLKPGLPCILLGTSMGAAASLRAVAIEKVNVDAVIVECPFDSLLATTKNRFSMMGLPTVPLAEFVSFLGRRCNFGDNTFAHRPMDYAKEVDVPTLQLHGEKDTRVTLTQLPGLRGACWPQGVRASTARTRILLAEPPTAWSEAIETFSTHISIRNKILRCRGPSSDRVAQAGRIAHNREHVESCRLL